MDNPLSAQVAALVIDAQDATDGAVQRIIIDVQASGEHPYRVEVLGQTYPDIGVAIAPSLSGSTRRSSSGVAGSKPKATSNG